MEKSTDSSSGSPASSSSTASSTSSTLSSGNIGGGGGSSTAPQQHILNSSIKAGGGSQATTHSSDGNQRQHPHHHHQQTTQPTTTTTTFVQKHQNNSSSSTKNQLNLLGCGPSATSTAAATFANSGNLKVSNGTTKTTNLNASSSPTSSTATPLSLSFNNSTLGHQSCSSAAAATSTTSTSIASSNVAAAASAVAITSSSSTAASSLPLSSTQMAPINLNISTTTGGNFSVTVDPQITVENLKKIIAKKLKVAKDRICLLHREKELQDGSLKENNLMDGSKIILIPNVETGLLAQRPENTVMQALESLNDSQVNDFLSGKTPLNLSMRLGDHMMLIQLQLSTVNPVNGAAHSGSNCSSSSRTRSSHHHHHHHHRSSSSRNTPTASTSTQTGGTAPGSATSATAAAPATAPPMHSHHHHHHHHHHHNNVPGSIASANTPVAVVNPTGQNASAVRKLELDSSNPSQSRTNAANNSSAVHKTVPIALPSARITSLGSSIASSTSASAPAAAVPTKSSDLSSFLSKRDYESLQNIVKSIAMAQPAARLAAPITNTLNAADSTVQSSIATVPPRSNRVPVVATSFHAPPSASTESALLEQSPIKSLSNLVSSSPIKTTSIKNIPRVSNNSNSSSANTVNSVALGPHSAAITGSVNTAAPTPICQDPIAAKLTSCLCTRLNGSSSSANMQPTSTPNYKVTNSGSILTPPPLTNGSISSSSSSSTSSSSSSRSSSSLHKTAHNAITRKHRHHHHHHHHHHHYHHPGVQSTNVTKLQPSITSTPTRGISNDSGFNSSDDTLNTSIQTPTKTKTPAAAAVNSGAPAPMATTSTPTTPVVVAAPLSSGTAAALPQTTTATANATATPVELDESGIVSDSRTLAEASRNLTQTLRKLSKEVFTNKIDFSASEEAPRKSGSGAVIESMKNHGKGIYSGTFSGTLNPALQDRYGRPKRDISTVIHILNDLLSATPQYHRGARISFEAPSTSAAAAASVAAASGSPGAIHRKHLSSKHHHSSHPCVKCIKTSHNASSSPAANVNAVSINSTGSLPTPGGSISSSSSSSSSICAYGECNGHYVSKSQSSKSYPCCQPELANTPTSHHPHHHHQQVVDERKVCQCRYRVLSETCEREHIAAPLCQKCTTEMDNMKTKSKLDQLRLVMQQRKQKREARKLKGAPYGARVVGATTAAASAAGVVDTATSTLTTANTPLSGATNTQPISVASAAATPSEVSPNHIVEEVDTAA